MVKIRKLASIEKGLEEITRILTEEEIKKAAEQEALLLAEQLMKEAEAAKNLFEQDLSKEVGDLKNGKRDGKWIFYDKKGIKEKEVLYDKGEDLNYSFFDEKGTKKREGKLVDGKECVFVIFDKNNIAKCSIESAYRKKKINFNKPISCHLYPVRVVKYDSFTAVNVDSWHVCKPACECGIELNVPVFKFLKDAIVRSWGLDFFIQLDSVYDEFFNEKNQNNIL